MTAEPSLTALLERLKTPGGGGWDGLDQWSEGAGQSADAAQDAHRQRAALYAAVFNTPSGREVLEDLLNRTLRAPTWVGGGLLDVVPQGLIREGQNSLVGYICKQLALAAAPPQKGE